MDALNHFETRNTFLLSRLEWLAGFAVAVTLTVMHWGDIRWPVFIGLFVVIDAIGYVPGALAFRRSRTGTISRNYHLAYNVMHSLLTGAAVAGLWAWLVRPEWALLAIPVHLLGDRGIFGNSLKPFRISFEPKKHALFEEFEAAWSRTASPAATRREGRTTEATETSTVRSSTDAASHPGP
ncbi:membrane protein [Streptomyces albireticuli]|uniref:Membrane protein n=1 Tax=Streptomyces albireticuli TaxID=1940 RepID=A0A1Z2KY51_9ACTN|nr:hypothetical protein [Streptomyces albireticuli]ARZ66982.1 membrane protein [Streptomyces albireticuli]